MRGRILLLLWSTLVSLVYAVVALAAPSVANVMVVAFIAMLVVPATAHLIRRDDDRHPHA